LSHGVDVDGDIIPSLIFGVLEIERPEHLRNAEIQRALCDVEAGTDTSAGAECEVVSLVDVVLSSGFSGAGEVVLESR
jgi:hypothetical protein